MSLTIPPDPRWYRALRIAQEFILSWNISHLPINPFDFYELYDNWVISDCENLLRNSKCSNLAKKILFKRIDAVTYYENGYYVTVYNEYYDINRIRWTIAHEIGHIVLDHFKFNETALLRGGLDEEKYGVLEVEAHCFAAELLAPTFILYDLGLTSTDKETIQFIKNICSISKKAARKRAKSLSKYKYTENQLEMRQQFEKLFSSFLKPIAICTNISNCDLLPPIKKLPKVIIMNKKYSNCETDESGRFKTCPKCGNTCFSEDALFCKICGLYLYNYCTRTKEEGYYGECGIRSPGDARYCEYCGAETILMAQGLLLAWDEMADEIDLKDLPF